MIWHRATWYWYHKKKKKKAVTSVRTSERLEQQIQLSLSLSAKVCCESQRREQKFVARFHSQHGCLLGQLTSMNSENNIVEGWRGSGNDAEFSEKFQHFVRTQLAV